MSIYLVQDSEDCTIAVCDHLAKAVELLAEHAESVMDNVVILKEKDMPETTLSCVAFVERVGDIGLDIIKVNTINELV